MPAKVLLAGKAAHRFGSGLISKAAVFAVAYWVIGKARSLRPFRR